MLDIKDINLTDDALTNILIMTPYLDDSKKLIVLGVIYGWLIDRAMIDRQSKIINASN